jgi:uncharacterized protein (DUF1684 family)
MWVQSFYLKNCRLMKINLLVLIGTISVLVGCSRFEFGPASLSDNYYEDVEAFYEARRVSLTEPQGWMRIAGMMWLQEGVNTFGGSSENAVIFPEGFIPARAGVFVLEGDLVTMRVDEGVLVSIDGEEVREAVMFDEGVNPMAMHETLAWQVIRRGDLTGIRLWNSFGSVVDTFTQFPRYEVDPKWNLKAQFVPHQTPTTVRIVNILGQEEDAPSPGIVRFGVDGQVFELIALMGGNRMFIIVGDRTNRTETYQAGRYIYIDYPAEGEDLTRIDFNVMYNPPCAYNQYTTCQMPPPQNMLPMAIEAGEKRPEASFLELFWD